MPCLTDQLDHLTLGKNLVLRNFESAVIEIGCFSDDKINKSFPMHSLVEKIRELGCIVKLLIHVQVERT